MGATPTQGLPEVFKALDGLAGFNNFTVGNDAEISEIINKVQSVDGAMAAAEFSGLTIDCGGSCDGKHVGDVQSIRFVLTAQGSKTGEVPFTSLGLPSVGFLPQGGTLDVGLNWSINVGVVADGSGLRLDRRRLTLTSSCSSRRSRCEPIPSPSTSVPWS